MWKESIADPKTSKADAASMQVFVDNASANDEWALKAFKPIGVLLTAHPGGRAFLKASVESHKKLGYWITLAYDNYFNPERTETYNDLLPPIDIIHNIDTFIMPHYNTWGGVLYPYFWLLKFGLNAMSGFEYVYCSNGDCILEKPENFQKIIDLLGDNDIMGCSWENNDRIFNTTAFIAKTSAAKAIIKHFGEKLIPFDTYDKYTQEMGNTEGRFAIAIKELGLKAVKNVVPGYNTQFHIPGFGTWYDLIGFRHIHAELGYAWKHKKIPPPIEYYDKRQMRSNDYECISKYYETNDISWLEKWWRT
jgi:hypothetical protein